MAWFKKSDSKDDATTTRALPASADNSFGPDADRPVTSAADDRFGRSGLAHVISRYIDSTPLGESVVFALTGAWGSGKTSVLHLVAAELARGAAGTTVVWFNPWLFSGAHEITAHFLHELGVQLGKKERDLEDIGKKIAAYAGFFGAVGAIGVLATLPWLAPLVGLLGSVGTALSASKKGSVQDARDAVAEALRTSSRRFVVIIDDIDRLDRDEIRAVFKLVRLVADFPNISYLLSFDRRRVEQALDDRAESNGREYLAKIVQAAFDIPQLDRGVLQRYLMAELDRALNGRSHGPFHESDWPDIVHSIVAPLVKTPRDARRYANAIGPIVDLLGHEVALEDVLALEAMRLFIPDVHGRIASHASLLTRGVPSYSRSIEREKSEIGSLIESGGEAKSVVREALKLLFPMTRAYTHNYHLGDDQISEWRRDRRVANKSVFDIYLERGIRMGEIASRHVQDVVAAFSEEQASDDILQNLDATRLEAMFVRLLDFHEELASVQPENGLVAVIRHADRLRHGRAGFGDFGADMAVRRLALFTLRSITDEHHRQLAIESILRRTHSLTWRCIVLEVVGAHDERQPLISAQAVEPLRLALREEILRATATRLLEERDPVAVVTWATYDRDAKSYTSDAAQLLHEPRLLRHILPTLLRERIALPIDSVNMTTSYDINFYALVRIFGDEDAMRDRLRAVAMLGRDTEDERMKSALALVDDLLEGRSVVVYPEGVDGENRFDEEKGDVADDESVS